ncbi:MAG TPA: hypothetical protein VJ697_07880 [Nitrososphaeraceae archaeon]|nr:hypothetical protein [Nitrososphaeraceae archaeon]
MNLNVFASFLAFAILVGISIVFLNVVSQKEAEQSPSSILPPILDDNNDDIIHSEEICPPYCNPPPPIQEIPKEEIP